MDRDKERKDKVKWREIERVEGKRQSEKQRYRGKDLQIIASQIFRQKEREREIERERERVRDRERGENRSTK